MVRLAQKAFHPAPLPFPLLHVDTTWKFRDMIEFRDRFCRRTRPRADRPHQPGRRARRASTRSITAREKYTTIMKTQALVQALAEYGFDAAFGGARRDEEKSRAKERVYSFRDASSQWDPKNQRPELWSLYNAKVQQGREHPRLPAVELDRARRVAVHLPRERCRSCRSTSPPARPVVEREGTLIMVDDERMRAPARRGAASSGWSASARSAAIRCRARSRSTATTLPEIIQRDAADARTPSGRGG